MANLKKLTAEMLGTMVLVLMGCGAAVFTQIDTTNVASVLTVALAFGLSVVAMAYTIGELSGCHINPAITWAMMLTKRISIKEGLLYMLFQVIGAIAGSAILYLLASNTSGLNSTHTGANGFTDGACIGAFTAEVVFTFIFVWVVLASTVSDNKMLAGLAIGLTLVLVHIVCIPITGTSVNPARSVGPALFEGGKALSQLWLFIVAPFIGATLSAIAWSTLKMKDKKANKKQ